MICFPLDNTPCEAKDMGTYLATRTRGVFSSDGNLAVTPGESGLSVSVSPGLAWLKWSDYWGTAALQEQALTLALDTADGALKRIDAIVCRLDKVNNRAEIVVKKGAPSSAPIVVPPVRDANYDELYIATVLIGAGVISISASAITDQRLNEEYCGLMRDGVTGIPTASLHAQAQQILTELTDALNAQIVRQSAEFDAWFDDLKGKLGEDPATALQLQVDNLNAAAVGDSFKLKGDPISIEAAGENRIASITAYGENAQGGTTEAPVALTGISSVTVNDDVTDLPIPRPLRRVGDVKDKCVTRQDYESAEKLVVTYNVGFVELDGTESVNLGNIDASADVQQFNIYGVLSSPNNSENAICSHFERANVSGGVDSGFQIYNTLLVFGMPRDILLEYGFITGDSDTYVPAFKAYLAAQNTSGTPVQVAYQLASPETYATDPVDFDNTAGPLTIMTGGEVVVRMTELVGSRSPELTGKMDKAVYAQVGNPSELDNDNFLHCVNQRNVSGTISAAGYFIDRWKLISGTVQITENGLVLNGKISQILENAAGTDVTASASAGAASYDNSTKTFTLTATGQTITWAKLEKGSVATPYVPKGYGAELVECYRYFWISSMPVNIFKTTAGDYFRNTVYFPIAMRTVPSVTILSSNGTVSVNAVTIDAVKFAGNGGNDTVTSFSASADL